jgi:23S rRNA (adenine2503-C2)-methyltransferase
MGDAPADAPFDQPAPELQDGPRPNVAGMDLAGLKALVAAMGESPFRAGQIHHGLYRMRWTAWDQFSNLSKTLRARLERETQLAWPVIQESALSEDGSTKHAFLLVDGNLVEGVHMPYGKRTTLCLSSQVGCAMGCTFCATGLMGIKRNLTGGEIAGQVITMLNAHGHGPDEGINLVFMGMGEPLHNLDNLMEAFALLTDPKGLGISPKRITLSTSGLVTGIQRLAGFKPRPRLALSLNATTDAYRSSIMPVNKVWNLEALAAALNAFPLESGERITLEYVLLKGVTDALEDGRRLADFALKFPSKVNLIPFNPHEGSGFEPPTEERMDELCALLSARGLTVSIRRSRGQDVAAACGQLVRERQG